MTTAFRLLFAIAWVCVGALTKWDARWIYVLVALAVIVGLWAGRREAVLLRILLLFALVFPIWKGVQRWHGRTAAIQAAADVGTNDAALISALVASEETYLKLAPKMRALSNAILDLHLPGAAAETLFASPVTVLDLGPAPQISAADKPTFEAHTWPVLQDVSEVSKADLWRPVLDSVAHFEHARVYILNGDHPRGDMFRYEAKSAFDGLAKMKSGEWLSLAGRIDVSWERRNGDDGHVGDWRISAWKTVEMFGMTTPKRLFAEALDNALRSPEQVAKLRRSEHYQATLEYYRGGMKTAPHPYFSTISANQKEGLAVADVDGDGFDDIYITVRIGKNMLLHNNGDGTFVEDAARFGLDLPGHTTCAIFADFDNDGDLDAMLGRSLLKTTYLENKGRRFYQKPIPAHFPMAVVSMSAADYNGDGLLDVYLCTYRAAAPPSASPAGGVAQVAEGAFDWPDEFFSPEIAKEFRRRLAENKKLKGGTVLDQVGPPNVLLINRGDGRFDPAPENSTVGIWRNSLQATWGDYDQDGDPDLFVANDWGPSNLYRNDRAAGFKDVTEEAGTTAYGFSMGASWGDYDNDGRDDVYISNMFSEAGRRMSRRVPGLSQMFAESAGGNWLYHHEANGKFTQVAGLNSPAMGVINAGWSWGGSFTDFDNDGFLDLYVLSGYFTAPKEFASELDLESNLWRTMLRTDEHMSRQSFRFSPEWKRTPPPDNLGPEIDARLGGAERQGDRLLVHSLNGNERNHYFANRGGRAFVDISPLSGLDNPADSRGFAVLDYDHDGWQDVALVNANQPLFNLYHNGMPAAGLSGAMIAIRFVGGNRSPMPSREFACRDGFGARVTIDAGDTKLTREHRCGDGWSTQHSATMIVGIGSHQTIPSVSVKWPSGKTISTNAVSDGTLLVVYENAADSPSGESFVRSSYRAKQLR